MAKTKDLMKIDGKVYKKEAFIIEDRHPAIGRILIIEGMKFKILDAPDFPSHRSGTFIAKLTEEDERRMREYDDALDEISEKLVYKVNVKEMIKQMIKDKPLQDIKTGLFILRAEEEGKPVTTEHHKGCYDFKIHYLNQTFEFMTINPEEIGGMRGPL